MIKSKNDGLSHQIIGYYLHPRVRCAVCGAAAPLSPLFSGAKPTVGSQHVFRSIRDRGSGRRHLYRGTRTDIPSLFFFCAPLNKHDMPSACPHHAVHTHQLSSLTHIFCRQIIPECGWVRSAGAATMLNFPCDAEAVAASEKAFRFVAEIFPSSHPMSRSCFANMAAKVTVFFLALSSRGFNILKISNASVVHIPTRVV